MFTSGKTRANRGFAKGACKMTNPGTFWLLAHSTLVEPCLQGSAPQLF